MVRSNEIIEVKKEDGTLDRFKMVELPVDPPNTVRRYLVPIETEEEDVPTGGRLLDEREAEGFRARAKVPENILIGDMVRRDNGDTTVKGTVEAKLKGGRFRVRFEDSTVERLSAKDMKKVW